MGDPIRNLRSEHSKIPPKDGGFSGLTDGVLEQVDDGELVQLVKFLNETDGFFLMVTSRGKSDVCSASQRCRSSFHSGESSGRP